MGFRLDAVSGVALARSERRLPAIGVLEEAPHLDQRLALEEALGLGDGEHVPPGGGRVELDAGLGEAADRLGEDAVVEDDEIVRHLGARLAQGIDEYQLAAAIGGE